MRKFDVFTYEEIKQYILEKNGDENVAKFCEKYKPCLNSRIDSEKLHIEYISVIYADIKWHKYLVAVLDSEWNNLKLVNKEIFDGFI